ncbi:hypothetical protein ACTOB_001246 [Actinoplanes oblitus]|uniref:Phage tail protein n=1 Tax=Actinoplanes oblitus TaxID=3040509 RepID=A0ABY8WKU4_9ACTN|nr:hypothetical protein [Actinoplanes oblitus]WIM97698.1 hypothetical protein ACTOB_001246 [Actinoplanes oblitus]
MATGAYPTSVNVVTNELGYDASVLQPGDTVLQALADAKGDLVVATGADAFTRLPAGTNGHVLKAASGQSTGLQWAAQTDTTTLPNTSGTASAGTSLLGAPADHVHPASAFGAGDHGLLGWNFDPALSIGSTILGANGTLYLARIKVPKAITVTNLHVHCTSVGATLTTGRNFAALFTAAGARVASTVDQSTAWTSLGLQTMALTSAQAIAAGDYYVGFYGNGSTLPTFARGTSLSAANTGLAAPNFRFASADTGLTTAMPSNIGAQTALSVAYWVGLS